MVGQTRSFSHCVRVALATLVSLGVHGCTDVKGGAVELSWKLRAAAGAADVFVACSQTGVLTDSGGHVLEDGHLTAIRLHWEGTATGSQDFNCSSSHGVTTFIVRPVTLSSRYTRCARAASSRIPHLARLSRLLPSNAP